MDLEEEALAFASLDIKNRKTTKVKSKKKNNKRQEIIPYTHCLSCNTAVSDAFCPNCGQKNDDMRRSLFALIADTLGGIFSFESRMWKTFGALIFKPGKIARQYADGARTRYSSPIRTYLVVSILFFTFMSVSNTHFISFEVSPKDKAQTQSQLATDIPDIVDTEENSEDLAKEEIDDIVISIGRTGADNQASLNFTDFELQVKFFTQDKEIYKLTDEELNNFVRPNTRNSNTALDLNLGFDQSEKIIRKVLSNPKSFNSTVNTWLPRAMFLMVPFAMLLGWFFNSGPKALLIDHLIHAIYLQSALFLGILITISASQLLSGLGSALGLFSFMSIYFMLSIKHMFKRGWIKTVWTTLMGGFLYWFILFMIMAAIVTYALTATALEI